MVSKSLEVECNEDYNIKCGSLDGKECTCEFCCLEESSLTCGNIAECTDVIDVKKKMEGKGGGGRSSVIIIVVVVLVTVPLIIFLIYCCYKRYKVTIQHFTPSP